MKKLAIIRNNSGAHGCPYGLSVGVACRNVGDAIARMEPLDAVPVSQQELQTQHNIAVYALHGTGTRCPYADQIAQNSDNVHCDWGEPGAKIMDFPMLPIQLYPRIYSGMGAHGYYSYPLATYWDNPGNASMYGGTATYASEDTLLINKNAENSETGLDMAAGSQGEDEHEF